MGEVIAFVSGKGGTGKTAVCAGASLAMAAKGFRVLCVDCDVGLRNLDLFLGMAESGALSFADVSQGGYRLSQALPHPQYSQLRFLTAPASRTAEPPDRAAFSRLMEDARQEFDYIFLDGPAGLGEMFRLVAESADRCVVVALSDPAAIRDAGRTGQELELMGALSVRLVVNRIQKGLLRQLKLTVDDVMDRCGLPLLGIVPEDLEVTLATAAGKSLPEFNKKSAALGACQRIAQRICGKTVEIPIGKFK